jgi:hypothetical protein
MSACRAALPATMLRSRAPLGYLGARCVPYGAARVVINSLLRIEGVVMLHARRVLHVAPSSLLFTEGPIALRGQLYSRVPLLHQVPCRLSRLSALPGRVPSSLLRIKSQLPLQLEIGLQPAQPFHYRSNIACRRAGRLNAMKAGLPWGHLQRRLVIVRADRRPLYDHSP